MEELGASLAPVVHPLTALLYLFQGFEFSICIAAKFNTKLELTGWSSAPSHLLVKGGGRVGIKMVLTVFLFRSLQRPPRENVAGGPAGLLQQAGEAGGE